MKKCLLLSLWALLCCTLSKAGVGIDSVKTTNSTCANNGTMQVFAQTSTGALLYAITSGPVTQPVQTNNVFSSLPPGTYTVEASNTANETTTLMVTVSGTYVLPDFVPVIIDPSCPDSSSGSIIGNLSFSTGISPYTWELVAPSPVLRPQQANDTFYNLPSGNYTIRLADACNNVQTKTVILFAAPIPMSSFGGFARITGCDTTEIGLGLSTSGYRPPYKIEYTIGGTAFTVDTAKIHDEFSFDSYPYIFFTVPNISYGGIIDNITVTNSCGVKAFIPQIRICSFELVNTNFTPISISNCQNGILTNFSLGNTSCTINVFPKFPLTLTIRDIPANNVVEVKTFHSPFDYTLASTAMAPGASYSVSMVDSCNNSYTTSITTPVLNRYVSFGANVTQVMLDSTLNASLSAVGFPTQGTRLTITSGPVAAHSTKPGYAYYEPYVYPKSFTGQLSSDSSTLFSFANAAPGTYTYIVTDSCGNQFAGSFTILPSDVASLFYSYEYQKGCVGSSGLKYEVIQNSFSQVNLFDLASGTSIHTLYGWQMNQNPYTTVVNNITASDYEFVIYYFGRGKDQSMDNILVDTFFVRDTIHITPYQNPALKTVASSLCNAQLFVAISADSSKGIPPYQYEIINGPQTFPPQSSNLFQLVLAGDYTIRLIDSCGNSVSTSVTVNPLVFPPLSGLRNFCGNDTALLTYGGSSYFDYSWSKPDGTIFSGDTLLIYPITTADTGLYTVKRITTINGCSNTQTTTYRLSLNQNDSTNISICNGQVYPFGSRLLTQAGVYRDTSTIGSCTKISILKLSISNYKQDSSTAVVCYGQSYPFGSRLLSQTGVYRDTIQAIPCDSISIVNLAVSNTRKDSTVANICTGQTFTFGARTLSQTGIYRDTFPGLPCDSVSILNLTVSNTRKDSAVANICTGQTFIFGTRSLSQTGIYRDTFPGLPCDSVSILNLTVGNTRKDSAVVNICTGQTFAFGARVLSQTGIYRDTFPGLPCDSVSIVNLTVSNTRKDSAVANICTGQTFTFGARVLSQTGIYRDTFPGLPCDSVSIVNLTVSNTRKDSAVANICTGQTFTFGARVLSQTGIYRDTFPGLPCDSVSIVNLTVSNTRKDSAVANICAGQTFIFGTRSLSQIGIYRDTIPGSPCDSISIINLIVNDTPSIQVQSDRYIVNSGEMIQLTAAPSTLSSYLWSSLNQLNSSSIFNPTSSVIVSSWYKVIVTDQNNCNNTDSVFVQIRNDTIFACDNRTVINIPSAFTPDGNGRNDLFKIGAAIDVAFAKYHLVIYDRWGNLIFETTNSSAHWDGSYKGKPSLPGNYVYLLNFTCGKRTVMKKGNVILIR